MTVTIPFSIEDTAKDCVIQLRNLAENEVIAEIFRGLCPVGEHSVVLDTAKLPQPLEAGVYLVHVTIGESTHTLPFQYMP